MVKLKAVVVFRSHLWLHHVTSSALFWYSSGVNQVAPERPADAPKMPIAAPKGLELVPRSRARTSDHRTCCQNLSWCRFWKAETVLEKQSFTCFLILPDEFINNQIDNLAITKNCQKGPQAARDPIHPGSGVETCTWGGPAWPWNQTLNTVLMSRSKEMNRICRSRRRAREQEPSCSEGNSFRTLKTNSGQQTADHEAPILLIPWRCMEWTSKSTAIVDMLQKHANQYSERSKSIILSNDRRLCDP